MDFHNIFRQFFGIPNRTPRDYDFNYDTSDDRPTGEVEDIPPWDDITQGTFEKNIEEHIHRMMQMFGMGFGSGPDGNHGGFDDFFGSIDQPQQSPSASLRDQYLKPGFEHPLTSKTDTDMDGKVDIQELDTMLNPTVEAPRPVQKRRAFFGQSMSTRTVVRPDGSVETTKATRDNEGNRETIVTHRTRDGEYTVTTRVDADGVETKEEQIVNHSNQPEIDVPHIRADSPRPDSWLNLFWRRN